MREKERRLRKLLALQEMRWKVETAKAARVESALRDLGDEERRLAVLLERDDPGAHIFPEFVLNRLKSTSQRGREATAQLERQSRVALEQKTMARRIEKVIERVDAQRRQRDAEEEKKRMLDRLHRASKVSAP